MTESYNLEHSPESRGKGGSGCGAPPSTSLPQTRVGRGLRDLVKFANKIGVHYPLAVATDDLKQKFGGLDGLPTTLLYDREGILRQKVIGFEYADVIESALKPLLSIAQPFYRSRARSAPLGRLVEGNPPRVAANALRQYHEFMNLGFPEMIFIFLLALIIFGPKKLPEIGRQIGKALNEFKRASNEFKSQIESEINSLDVEIPRQTILPPAQPPAGAIAAGNHESSPEVNSAAKAPDA